jgi:hypothetical protein
MQYVNNLPKRHLWRVEVGTSFSLSRPYPPQPIGPARQAILHPFVMPSSGISWIQWELIPPK